MWNGVGAARDWTLIHHWTYEMMWSTCALAPFWSILTHESWKILKHLEKSWDLACSIHFYLAGLTGRSHPEILCAIDLRCAELSQSTTELGELRPFLPRDAFQTFRRFCCKKLFFSQCLSVEVQFCDVSNRQKVSKSTNKSTVVVSLVFKKPGMVLFFQHLNSLLKNSFPKAVPTWDSLLKLVLSRAVRFVPKVRIPPTVTVEGWWKMSRKQFFRPFGGL